MRSFFIALFILAAVVASPMNLAVAGESAVKQAVQFSEVKSEAREKYNMVRSNSISLKKFAQFLIKVRSSPALSQAFLFAKNHQVTVYVTDFPSQVYGNMTIDVNYKSTEEEMVTFLCGMYPCPAEG